MEKKRLEMRRKDLEQFLNKRIRIHVQNVGTGDIVPITGILEEVNDDKFVIDGIYYPLKVWIPVGKVYVF